MDERLYEIAPGAALPKGGALEVGNKALTLMSLAAAGLPVPPAFVLPTHWCGRYRGKRAEDAELRETLALGTAMLERATNLRFGSPRRPLLVSVRAGGTVSMPGMLETVLDIGMNQETVDGLIRLSGNPRLAWTAIAVWCRGMPKRWRGSPRALSTSSWPPPFRTPTCRTNTSWTTSGCAA